MKGNSSKRIFAAVMSAVMLCSAAPTAGFTGTAADSDVVYSSGFEDGDVSAFVNRGADDTTVITTSTELAFSGSYSLCASGRSSSWNGPAFRLDDKCKAGTEYLINAAVSGQYYTGITVSYQYSDSSGTPHYVNLESANASGWVQFEDLKVSFSEDVTDVYVYFEGGTDNIYVDDFSVKAAPVAPIETDIASLKDVYGSYFKLGTSITTMGLSSQSTKNLILKHFNSITLGNELKPDAIIDREATAELGDYNNPQINLAGARTILNFCRDNNIPVRGHTLVWHSQTPDWFFKENFSDSGNWVDKDTMLIRMENYIKNVFAAVEEEYPTVDFYAWDVVNEAWLEDGSPRQPGEQGSGGSANSAWVKVFGDNSFIEPAFEFARKYAPEGCKLYYNDYNEYMDGKMNAIIAMAEDLKAKGLIDGIGMQSHLDVRQGSDAFPSAAMYEKALAAYAATGLDIQVTELDATVPANSGEQYFEAQAQYYSDIMDAIMKYKDNISAVVFWGTTDDKSWRANQSPLLFNADYTAKPAYYSIVDGLDVPVTQDNSITVEVYDIDTGELVPGIKMALSSFDTTPGVDGLGYLSWNTSDENPKTFTGLSNSPVAYEVYIEDAESAGYHEATDATYAIEFTEDMDTNSVTFRIPVQKYETDVVYGDANDDGSVDVSDAVFILQGIADPSSEEFKRTAAGEIQADCYAPGGGVDAEDALTILRFKADIVTALPVNS